jgi:putative pyrroloquinoline-quinone binding quinoprotein
MNRTLGPVVLSLALSVTSSIHAHAGQPPIWTYKADCAVRWYRPTPSGILLVGTEREIIGVAPDSGTVAWRLGPVKDSNASDVELLAHSAAAVLSLKKQGSGLPSLSLIDVRDGKALWTSDTLGLSQSIGSFLIPGTDKLVLRARASEGDNETAMLVELASGTPIWMNEDLAEHRSRYMYKNTTVYPHYALYMDTDSTMIVATQDASFLKLNLGTGDTVWKGSGNPAPEPHPEEVSLGGAIHAIGSLLSHGSDEKEEKEEPKPPEVHEMDFRYAPILEAQARDRFYAPYRGTVAAFSMANGQCLWPNPPALMGLAAQMAEFPSGLLVRVIEPEGNDLHHKVVLLDKDTGAVKWRWPSSYWSAASNFIVEDKRAVIAAEGTIRAVDLASGKAQAVGKLKFEDADEAQSLLAVPDRYVAIGKSNLGIYSKKDGQRTKKYYRPPPDDTGWGLALLGVSALTWSLTTVETGPNTTVSGGLDPMVGLNKLVKDYSSSRESDTYAYFLADAEYGREKGVGIVRVARETGDLAGQVLLGKKKPDYALDADGRLYFKSDSKEIRCYRF